MQLGNSQAVFIQQTTLIVFLLSLDYLCSVSLPRCAMGNSVIYDCVISRSYSIVFILLRQKLYIDK